MKQGINPYLPSWEYIPDGEPHVFGNRVYVYGSHDRFNGYSFCLNDYVCYSAPIHDLTEWRYEGIIYSRTDDPRNRDGEMCLYAPDVVRGADGRYYLYYVLDADKVVSVAVCDQPAGKYFFLGYVHDKDGGILGERDGDESQFDPGVLYEGGKVYLYTGSCPPGMKERTGPMVTVLEQDMLTIREEPVTIAPSEPYSKGSSFEGHEFFEASSIRRIKDTYYFIYSTIYCHDLCYATSASPVSGFTYRGRIISNTDRGISAYKDAERPMGYDDNNHGSIECINGKWYIFYHRHTNGNSFSRQACLEPIEILEDGTIPQVEMTSCGPNGGPLAGNGIYPAYLACNLYCKVSPEDSVGKGVPGKRMDPRFPYITQDGRDGDENEGYIANMEDGACAGYKYFICENTCVVGVKARGWCQGVFDIMTEPDGEVLGSIEVSKSNEWKWHKGNIRISDGKQALYFKYRGFGCVSLGGFELEKR